MAEYRLHNLNLLNSRIYSIIIDKKYNFYTTYRVLRNLSKLCFKAYLYLTKCRIINVIWLNSVFI